MRKLILTVLTLATVFVGCNKDEIAGLENDLAKERLYNRGYQNEVNKILQELAASQEALTAAEGDITMLNAVISTANAQINELDGTVADQAAAISDLNDVISSAEDQIADLEADLKAANDSIAELTASISTLEKLVQSLRNSQVVNVIEVVEVIQQVTEVVGFTQAQLDAAVAAVPTGTSSTTGFTQEDINAEVAAAVAVLQAQIDALPAQSDLEDLQALLVACNTLLDEANANSIIDEATITALESTIEGLNSDIADLEADLDAALTGVDSYEYTAWVGDAPAADVQTGVTTTTAASDVQFIDEITTITTTVAEYTQTRTSNLVILGTVDVPAPVEEALTRTISATTSEDVSTVQIANPAYVAPPADVLSDWSTFNGTNPGYGAELTREENNNIPTAGSTVEFVTETYDLVTYQAGYSYDETRTRTIVSGTPSGDLSETRSVDVDENIISTVASTREVANSAYVDPGQGNTKDLDNDGDVDYADAVLAGYEVVSVGGSPGGWNVEYNASAIADLGLVNTLVSNQTIGQYNLSFDTVDAAIAQKYAEDQVKDAYIAL